MRFKETEKVELKKSTAELKQAMADLCAFANVGEGTIYFGITDAGTIVGQNVSDATIKRGEQFVLRNIKKSAWINPNTGRREEQYEIPYLAIREAIANAVAHRDYKSPGNVDIAIFDDRIEVWSPGRLPSGISIFNIRSEKSFSLPRNPVISEALFLAGYIEKWGTGINKMNRLMQERDLPLPEYDEIGDNFVVVFKRGYDVKSESYHTAGKKVKQMVEPRHEPVKPEMPSKPKSSEKIRSKYRENTEKIRRKYGVNTEKVFLDIKENPFIKTREISNKTGLSQSTVEKAVSKLKKEGLLKRMGSDKSGYWEVLK